MKPDPYMIDDENPEWTAEDWAKAKRGYEIFTPEQLAGLKITQAKMREERLAKESSLKRVSLTLDEKVIAHFKASGKGWQQRINQALLEKLPA